LPLPHIAVRDKDTGDFKGVVVDLSRELGKRLNVPVEFVTINSNVSAVDQVKNGDFLFESSPLRVMDYAVGAKGASTERRREILRSPIQHPWSSDVQRKFSDAQLSEWDALDMNMMQTYPW
jgi:hypothetical protein